MGDFDWIGDDLAELLNSPAEDRSKPSNPLGERHFDRCPRCHGTGRYGNFGQCFACKGKGGKEFKTSYAHRAAERVKREDRKDAERAAWAAEHKVELEWLINTAGRIAKTNGTWTFPQELLNSYRQYGSLTDNQVAAVRKCIARDAERRAAQAEKAPVVDTAGIDRLKASFDRAVAYSAEKGLKLSPRITIDGLTISPAKSHSKNPGALYVKAGGEYLGKIAGGRFFAVAACTSADQAKVLAFVADPAEAAKVYGQTTGTCCVCNATLRSEWKHRGIGPICAEKFGWGSAEFQ